LNIRLATKLSAIGRRPFRSNGNCKFFPRIGPEPLWTFDTNRQAPKPELQYTQFTSKVDLVTFCLIRESDVTSFVIREATQS